MSIKKRLLLSNIGMVIIPVILFIVLEMIIGYILFYPLKGEINKASLDFFLSIRLFILIFVLILTNGLLTFLVSKSIINPLRNLKKATREISSGNLDAKVEVTGSNDELSELAHAFEIMRRKLKEAHDIQKQYEENQKELIASISHDLKTPLTSIKGYIRGISDGVANTPEKMDRYIKIVEKKADEMESLISELLLYSKLDLPHVPYEMRELDLLAYFEDYLEDLRPHLAKRNIHITLEYDRSHSYLVMADREKLNRVVANIVQNSISFMDKENKHLKFKLTSNNKEVLIEIQDNGMGVSRDELPYLFDRFYRTDVSRNSTTGGSGLGLAIVKKIIDGHGGAVWARGDIGQGLRIYFTLKKRVEADHVEQDIGD
ncbi:HAMP domain-containing sensor histidine kinase [Siminovitchia sp. FSL H7-0308]|uniref:histidine kinase n=1 Tax=Siminovitchia thermophila TaxID=1245522 RepID=A0ABS2R412_9BACI|nr:HAMP domain-containing sensor histidine kinase [Siminovitchia thermophila]MBM7713889.1 signal transduction histidine kinase [Siminovitchia thermophila]